MALVWELTKETIHLLLGCLQGGWELTKETIHLPLGRLQGGWELTKETIHLPLGCLQGGWRSTHVYDDALELGGGQDVYSRFL